MSINIRKGELKDLPVILDIFEGAIRYVNAKDFNTRQVDAWARRRYDDHAWQNRMHLQHVFIAEIEGEVTGFATIDHTGYLDMLFVSKDHQNMGTGSALLAEIDLFAKRMNFKAINVHASITARPFFESKGYEFQQENEVELDGVDFVNFELKKKL